ncbi:hypothetical protein HD592_000195 [Schaalia hyovaginalis]|uniref:Uncharacterized protein n=1 Tax=Schaalia hyovaginalis TaxID=29316 RepID=A0A923E316_9ACTO|nr:hypothetical protein [Schaalia hyovaginalis]
MVASSTAILAAQNNEDLKARARALGATLGMTSSEVDSVWDQTVVKPVDETGASSIATVLEYTQESTTRLWLRCRLNLART